MALKVANYNSLQREAQMLRERYDNLQRKVKQTNEQLATLESLADEVTTAYGVKKRLAGSLDLVGRSPAGSHHERHARRIQLSPHHESQPATGTSSAAPT